MGGVSGKGAVGRGGPIHSDGGKLLRKRNKGRGGGREGVGGRRNSLGSFTRPLCFINFIALNLPQFFPQAEHRGREGGLWGEGVGGREGVTGGGKVN